jgi:hypothetical protein
VDSEEVRHERLAGVPGLGILVVSVSAPADVFRIRGEPGFGYKRRRSAALCDMWVGIGGEGIVLKERTSVYRPGVRSPAWLKLKPKLTLEVVVAGGSADCVRWGDWGEAVMIAFRYTHPRTGADVEIRQAVRAPRDQAFNLTIGDPLTLVCWGVMLSGMRRHPVLLSTDRC